MPALGVWSFHMQPRPQPRAVPQPATVSEMGVGKRQGMGRDIVHTCPLDLSTVLCDVIHLVLRVVKHRMLLLPFVLMYK